MGSTIEKARRNERIDNAEMTTQDGETKNPETGAHGNQDNDRSKAGLSTTPEMDDKQFTRRVCQPLTE